MISTAPGALLSLLSAGRPEWNMVVSDGVSRLDLQGARDRLERELYAQADLDRPVEDCLAALSTFRQEMEGCSPEFQRSFLALDRGSRNRLVELYFGPYPHRVLPQTGGAVPLARFLAESGFHRELALSLFSEAGDVHSVLSLGTAGDVYQERDDDTLVLHTHPLTDEEIEEFFLPSDPDISAYMGDAVRHRRLWKSGAGAALSVYDPDLGVFKNWILSSYGISRTEVELAAEDAYAGVRVFYAVRPGFEDDEKVLENLDPRRLEMRAFLKGRNYGTEFRFLATEGYESIVQSLPRDLRARRETAEAPRSLS